MVKNVVKPAFLALVFLFSTISFTLFAGTAQAIPKPDGDLYVPVAESIDAFLGKISSGYGMRLHPTMGTYTMHHGTDFSYRCKEPLYSVAEGEVSSIEDSPNIGRNQRTGNSTYVTIKSGEIEFRAIHMEPADNKVKVGDKVGAGQEYSKVDTFGRSTGCHLHFEMIVNGQHRNPQDFFNKYKAEFKVPDGSVTGPGSGSDSESQQSGISVSGESIVSEDELTGMPEKRKFYEDPETGEKIEIPDHMLMTDLSEDEAASAAQLMASVDTYNESSKVNWLNVGVMLMGLGLIFYSVLLIVAYSFDKVNVFFQVPLVSVLTFGRLRAKESDDPNVDGFIPPKGVFIRSGIAFTLGILLVSGWFYWLMLWVFQLVQAWAVENL